MRENPVREKSYAFALRVVKMYKYLVEEKKEYILSKQVLRSGTSIGANIEEALGGSSRKDFIAKFTIAYKESRETNYWIRLLRDSGYLKPELALSLLCESEEITKLITSILKSSKISSE